MINFSPGNFAEKYRLALEAASTEKPQSGLCGFELEWNLLDSQLRPLLTVGAGPNQKSFVDYLRADVLSPWVREYSQLGVFHWMIEWATRPYYQPRGAVQESRLMEAVLLNALDKAGREFHDQLYCWHGNLLFPVKIGHDSIPGSWHLAKRRYLERCVDLYNSSLATAGTHTNLSLPDNLFTWDFMHLAPSERGDQHLDDYKSQFYITASRLLRAFAAVFIATSASTPLQAQIRDGKPVTVITEIDSVRNLTFPNPATIDLPNLYRSYNDYLQLSYDLVRRGVRFGNNNWTPVRARSFAEPVERLIAVTSDQLDDLYARGLYAIGSSIPVEEMARQIEIQNLMARINLPMSRVEVRTDDGGHPVELDVANLTFKQLLIMRFYGDPQFARSFRYDHEDITRARRNEELTARFGLSATIENPLTGKPVEIRDFLRWTLNELRPLADALEVWSDLNPLMDMAAGAPNTAQQMRQRIKAQIGNTDIVPVELLRELAGERVRQVSDEVEGISASYSDIGIDTTKLGEFVQHARESVRSDPQAPIRFRPKSAAFVTKNFVDKTSEVIALAQELIRIPSVTACPNERLDEVRRASTLIFDYVRMHGLGVRYYDGGKYPALLIGFPGEMHAPVMLSGHFDVVSPEPDDSQFIPRIEGDYLWGRGAADMKTVVATNLVWMKDMLLAGPPYPRMNLLLVGNEENGEAEPMGTPHVLHILAEEDGYAPEILIAGERTGEKGIELNGEVCVENRGVIRFDIVARGERGHSGVAGAQADLTERLLVTRATVTAILAKHLRLSSPDGWHSQARFPFIQVGTPGVYNVTADYGVIGVEIRPIPQDDVRSLQFELNEYAQSQGLEFITTVNEPGVACDPANPFLLALVRAVAAQSGKQAVLGRKLPGTSARFAPRGQGVVWGQTGIGPHSAGERHFIPSILPYYQSLSAYARQLNEP